MRGRERTAKATLKCGCLCRDRRKVGSDSAFSGGKISASRTGNVFDSIADDDTDTYAVTYNNQRAEEDWFAVTA